LAAFARRRKTGPPGSAPTKELTTRRILSVILCGKAARKTMTDQIFLDGVLKLCQHVEALVPGSRTGICMANEDGSRLKRAFFPNLPLTFEQAIRDISQLPPYFGSCNAAMHGREVITTDDMNQETRFDDRFVAHCLAHSIVALQSRPIYDGEASRLVHS